LKAIPGVLLISIFLTLTLFGCTETTVSEDESKAKVFVDIPLEIVGSDINFTYHVPDVCSIEVEGETDLIDLLMVDDVRARINAEGLEPGLYDNVPILCEVPGGITVIGTDPAEISVGVEFTALELNIEDVMVMINGRSDDFMYQISKPFCDVLVVGPSAVVELLTHETLEAYVDASGLEMGTHELTISVTILPEGVSLIGTDPGEVFVMILEPITDTV